VKHKNNGMAISSRNYSAFFSVLLRISPSLRRLKVGALLLAPSTILLFAYGALNILETMSDGALTTIDGHRPTSGFVPVYLLWYRMPVKSHILHLA